jgi:hypothetical protein
MADLIDLVKLYPTSTGGGGVSDHPSLSDLDWASSGHTGTASKFAGFDSNGAAVHLDGGIDFGDAIVAAMIFGG